MAEEKKQNKKKRTVLQKIVNVFLYILIGLFVLVLILIGITQTSTFRNYLREQVLEIANTELNGELNISRIDGTIFTSLILHDIVINMEEDTILNAQKLELRTSPLKLLVKQIYVRKLAITNAKINLITDSEGVLNIAKLFPESEDEDTTASDFPFTIEAAEVRFENVDLNFQNYNLRESHEMYDELVLDDLRIRQLNLLLAASLDINENDYRIELKQFSLNPNVNDLNLQNLTGIFTLTREMLRAEDLLLITDNSNVEINASLIGYDVFDTLGVSHFEDASLKLRVTADRFDFDDLARMTSMNMLKGKINADIDAEGSLKNLIVNNIEISLEQTHLQASGSVQNAHEPDSMFLNFVFEDTYVNQNDISRLMADSDIPVYREYGLLRFDTLTYAGTTDDFAVRVLLRTDRGSIYTTAKVNLREELIKYDALLRLREFDLAPVAGISTRLNINSDIKGIGYEPATILADVNLTGDGSTIEGNRLDTLRLTADSKNQILNYNLTAVMDTASARLTGFFNFENEQRPVYELEGALRNLNLATFSNDSTMESSLNFDMTASGESFNPDSMNLFLNMTLSNSVISGIEIENTRAIVDLQNGEEGERVINIISDLADITFIGKYSVDQAAAIIEREIDVLTTLINEQLEQIVPSDTTAVPQQEIVATIPVETTPDEENEAVIDPVMNIRYLVDFKDFTLLSLFLGNNSQIEINGEMNGEISSDGENLDIVYNTILQYIKYRSEEDVFFLSNLNLNVNLRNSLDTASIDHINADLKLTTDRIFMGSDINGLSLDLSLKNRAALINFSAQMENYASVRLNGGFNVSDEMLFLNLDTLNMIYKGFELINRDQIRVGYSEDEIKIEQFVLTSDSAIISFDGSLLSSGDQSLNFRIENLSANKLSTTILEARPENALSATINMDAKVTGNRAAPLIDINLLVDSVTYKNQTFGYLETKADYKNHIFNADIRFIDTSINVSKPALLITAAIPLDLSQGGEAVNLEGSPMNISVNAEDFNLAAFGDILPGVNRLRGKLDAKLNINGTADNLNPEGFIRLTGGAFIAEANNLEYYAGLTARINGDEFTLDSLVIQNSSDTPDGGTMTGSGKARLNNLEMVSSEFSVNGELKVLSPNSKSASPSVFGDLVIATKGNVDFQMTEDGATLKAPIVVKRAELTFPPTQAAYENTAANFVYKFVEDTITAAGGESLDFESLVEISRQRGQSQEIRTSKESHFDYEITVDVENEAEIIFVLSRELNQNLSAVLKGKFSYASIKGKTTAQGELSLLEGSTLEFIKTFEAAGSLRFENELNNPYLDITATYRDYYYPADSAAGANEVQVAVKIKLRGFLEDLDKTFIREENNIAVYYGESNIEEDVPDPTKTPTDAIMFIITGQFASDLTQSERTAAAGQFSGTATAMAGSLLGGFLNRQFGDYVRSVELRRVGNETKFNLSGRVKNFRYTIGGSTNVFEDLSQANVRIEYPIFQNFLLRLERKEAITERTINTEMINEVGLKYRFEF